MKTHHRSFARLAGATAVVALLVTASACGSDSKDGSGAGGTTGSTAGTGTTVGGTVPGEPVPVPASEVKLSMPKDMYLHEDSPTEWWWHIGTLRAGDRTFGFEINAASFEKDGFAFSQIMLTDVDNQEHYQRTTPYVPPNNFDPATWAASDVTEDWYARLGDEDNAFGGVRVTAPGSGYTAAPTVTVTGDGTGAAAIAELGTDGGVSSVIITDPGTGYTTPPTITLEGDGSGATAEAFSTFVSMAAPAADPTQDMRVKALLIDDPSMKPIEFDLTLSQQGRPFFVWGTGANGEGSTVQDNNFYVSLTRLKASGTITVDGEVFEVEGTTWMDHQYGVFGTQADPVKWVLQDMQLDNGFTISSYGTLEGGDMPQLDVPLDGYATLQNEQGEIYVQEAKVTPTGPTWTSPESGQTFFTQFHVSIPAFDAEIDVTTLMDSQEFPIPTSPVYEGVARAEGTFQGTDVAGEAWIEQTF